MESMIVGLEEVRAGAEWKARSDADGENGVTGILIFWLKVVCDWWCSFASSCNLISLGITCSVFCRVIRFYFILNTGWRTENVHWCCTKENSSCQGGWED
ncbi:hypothetical protein L6452_30589 [Arctium lappa]|uniref:Uncharacterized protein n=1 Tax=Arctium lappa TaxID=4217 RepID=A0ACB8ZIH9_ARCLA|nr:hypothetical protein L6452_30589 [Arctium lappa]